LSGAWAKIAVVDGNRVFLQSMTGRQLQSRIEKLAQDQTSKIDEIRKKMKSLQEEIDPYSAVGRTGSRSKHSFSAVLSSFRCIHETLDI